jgi:hypothetical protein
MRRLTPLLALLLLLAGCGVFIQSKAPVLSDGDVTGVWHNDRAAALTFHPDGTFEATDLPYQLFEGFSKPLLPDGFNPQHDKLPSTGSWKVDHNPAKTSGPRTHVVMVVQRLVTKQVGTEIAMVGRRNNDRLELYFFVGDPDSNNLDIYRKDG